jgi:hypothetical protein
LEIILRASWLQLARFHLPERQVRLGMKHETSGSSVYDGAMLGGIHDFFEFAVGKEIRILSGSGGAIQRGGGSFETG